MLPRNLVFKTSENELVTSLLYLLGCVSFKLSDLVDGIMLSPGLQSEWLPYHLPLPPFPGLINHIPVGHCSLYATELTLTSIPSAAVC